MSTMDILSVLLILTLVMPLYIMLYLVGRWIDRRYNVIETAGLTIINATIARVTYNKYELIEMIVEYQQMAAWLVEHDSTFAIADWVYLRPDSDPLLITCMHKKITKYMLEVRTRSILLECAKFIKINGSPMINNLLSQLNLSDPMIVLITKTINLFS